MLKLQKKQNFFRNAINEKGYESPIMGRIIMDFNHKCEFNIRDVLFEEG